MSETEKMSFTAASTFPAKLFHSDELIAATRAKMIPPIHVQLVLTNKCNLKCDYCSCREVDRTEELSYQEVVDIMYEFKKLGCRAVTITGGGEPLLHPQFEEIVTYIREKLDIQMGLVTNGLLLNTVKSKVLNLFTWCRISHDDDRGFGSVYRMRLSEAIAGTNRVDWAFSYVLTRHPDYKKLARLVGFATGHGFTHVRVVSDLLDLDAVQNMKIVKEEVLKYKVNDKIVVYQGRKDWVHGTDKCWMSLLKPTVGANGFLYPCCGAQYAEEEPSRNYGDTMRFCHWLDIDEVWKQQFPFNGSICEACYYNDYNEALKIMTSDLEHKEFV